MQPPSLTRLLKLANIILGPITLNCLAFFFFFCAVPGAAVRNGTEFNIPGMQFLS